MDREKPSSARVSVGLFSGLQEKSRTIALAIPWGADDSIAVDEPVYHVDSSAVQVMPCLKPQWLNFRDE